MEPPPLDGSSTTTTSPPKVEQQRTSLTSDAFAPVRPKRSISSVNATTQFPVHVKLSLGADVIRGDSSRGVSTERGVAGEIETRQRWVYEWIDGIADAFMLRSAKTGQYLGCLGRGGQLILHLFEFSFNRSRELAFTRSPSKSGVAGHWRFRHVATGLVIDSVSTRPKTLGCVLLAEDEEVTGGDVFEESVKTPWSFNVKGRAITCQANGTLRLEHKGVFSWAPYFEFVAAPGSVAERFYLRVARPASEDLQFLSLAEDGRALLARQPAAFNLVPTLKSGCFFVRDCVTKRLLVHGTAGKEKDVLLSTDSINVADTFTLMDVKDVVFAGQRVLAGLSPAWLSLFETVSKLATKQPISHPVYAHLPSVFEREMSAFAALYFAARCNYENAVVAACAETRPLLDSREKVLLANVEQSFNMIPAIMSRDTPLFRALDKAVANAKQAVHESDKLFSRYAALDPPHVTALAQEDDDTFVRIALFSDYGSGKPKARALLQALFGDESTRPHIVVHLGDVYKKGTRREQLENLIQPLVNAITSTKGEPVRVYALPGNHDYFHHGGDGYFWALDELKRLDLSKQSCSFFCLHVGKNYAIVGLDTGLGSLKTPESDSLDVQINEEQRVWLKQRMEECLAGGRRVIVLTHHPVLSSGPPSFGQVNAALWNELSPYLDSVCAWFWGHEHSFRVYAPYVGPDGRTLQRGRLIGHGSKWKKSKSDVVPVLQTIAHPRAREIGLAILEISEDVCMVKYMELSGEGDAVELVENYREQL